MFSTGKNLILSLFLILTMVNCSSQPLKQYEEFIKYSDSTSKLKRLPVIIVPGIKGSLLSRGDEDLWGKSYRVALLSTFKELEFPIDKQLDSNFENKFAHFYAKRNIKEGGIMEKYCVAFPFLNLWDVSIYHSLKKALIKSGGYHFNEDLFLFSYDWRLDNRISAAILSFRVKKCQDIYLNNLKKKFPDENDFKKEMEKFNAANLLTKDGRIKVILISHSMGGLVSRYYIQVLGGGDTVSKLIMLGTPNQGTMDALKAIAEGEYPESIFHWYFKGSTRPIIFSWPSIFQLLPRYQECIKNKKNEHENLDRWGLQNSYNNKIVIENWKKYNLIPPIDKLAGAETQETLDIYLKEQLISAIKFYDAINGNIDNMYEEAALLKIKSFGQIASIELDTEKKFIKGFAKTPFVIFGGHCEPTLKYLFLNKSKDGSENIEFDNPSKNKEINEFYTMGDGRVPINSLRLPSRRNLNDFQFLLCENHSSLVSNTTFQYNLLRELLWQSEMF